MLRFQSAPLAEARGDLTYDEPAAKFICFNPLPLPKQGEMPATSPVIPDAEKFQSAPLAEARGDLLAEHLQVPRDVPEFQSAPLAEARGDEFRSTVIVHSVGVFQSAPLAEARGDGAGSFRCAERRLRFNPLPLPKQGEMP